MKSNWQTGKRAEKKIYNITEISARIEGQEMKMPAATK